MTINKPNSKILIKHFNESYNVITDPDLEITYYPTHKLLAVIKDKCEKRKHLIGQILDEKDFIENYFGEIIEMEITF